MLFVSYRKNVGLEITNRESNTILEKHVLDQLSVAGFVVGSGDGQISRDLCFIKVTT